MKKLYRLLIEKTANNPFFWRLYLVCHFGAKYLQKVYNRAAFHRESSHPSEVNDPDVNRLVATEFSDLTVQHGLFKGMRYASAKAAGSSLLPKLLGSYEAELLPVLQGMVTENRYTDIVDIGCAEGYYVVGFGMKFPDAKIYAFDTNPKAKKLCREMAQLNGVEDRLKIGDWCDAKVLSSLPLGERALIISDCEGYEQQLFSPEVARALARHDILVEVHDFLETQNADTLRHSFSQTHDITVVTSLDDAMKVRRYSYPELVDRTPEERLLILTENRGRIMEWYIMTPKSKS